MMSQRAPRSRNSFTRAGCGSPQAERQQRQRRRRRDGHSGHTARQPKRQRRGNAKRALTSGSKRGLAFPDKDCHRPAAAWEAHWAKASPTTWKGSAESTLGAALSPTRWACKWIFYQLTCEQWLTNNPYTRRRHMRSACETARLVHALQNSPSHFTDISTSSYSNASDSTARTLASCFTCVLQPR
jgi:hypothetical protein